MAAGNTRERLVVNWRPEELTAEHGLAPADAVHLESVIWVGASTSTDEIRHDSKFGPRIDLFAPGDAIISATNRGDDSTNAKVANSPEKSGIKKTPVDQSGPLGGTSFVSHDNKGTLITTNFHTLRRLPTSLES